MNRLAKHILLDQKLIHDFMQSFQETFLRGKKDIDHYCSNCNAYIGTYHAGC